MAAKKSSTKKSSTASTELAAARATIKKLKATVGALEKSLAKAEKKADGLKSDLKKLRTGAVTQAKKAKAGGAAKVKKSKTPVEVIAEHAEPVAVAVEPEPEGAATAQVPSSQLTVGELRAAAREQGIAGYSRMRKEQLIRALS